MDDERPTDDWPEGLTGRGLRGRRMARLMIVLAIVPALLTGALIMTSSSTMGGPMFLKPPDPTFAEIIVGAGILAYVVGLAWMVRIYGADPEAHASFWRSRRY
jgi:hypothetical protein